MNLLKKFSIHHPKKIIVFFIIISAVFATLLPDLKLNTSTKSLVEENAPYTVFYEKIKKIFGNEEVVFVTYRSEDALSSKSLHEIKKLSAELEKIEFVDKVQSIINAKDIRFSGSQLESTPLYSEIPRDPSIIALKRQQALDNPLFRNVFISADGRTAGIAVYFKSYSNSEDYKNKILERTVLDIEEAIRHSNLTGEIHIGGLPIVRKHVASYMLNDMIRFVPLTLILVIFVLTMTFRKARGVIFPLLTIFVTILWTVGTMIFFDVEITIVTSILVPLLVVLSASYIIHFMSHYEMDLAHFSENPETGRNIDAIRSTFTHISKPLFFIALTTAAGFMSLGSADIAPIRDLGLFLSLGIGINCFTVNTLLPACLALIANPVPLQQQHRKAGILDRALDGIHLATSTRPNAILIGSLIVTLLAAASFTKLRVEMDNMSFFKRNDKVRVDNEWICREFSGINAMSVVLWTEKEDYFKSPEILKAMSRFQKYLEAYPEIDSTTSIADYVKRMNRAINDDDPGYDVIPDTRDAVSQYLLLYENSGDTDGFKRLVDYDFSKSVVLYRVNSWNMKVWRELARKIESDARQYFPDDVTVKISGSLMITAIAFDQIVATQIKSLSLAFVIVSILMYILFRSFRLMWLSLIPNILPILINFGMMGFLGIRLDLATAIIACVALGIGVDDTIHFTFRFLSELEKNSSIEKALQKTIYISGKPMIRTTLAIVIGFSVFAFSKFSTILHFGCMTGWIMAVCVITDLFLYPVVLAKFYKPIKKSSENSKF